MLSFVHDCIMFLRKADWRNYWTGKSEGPHEEVHIVKFRLLRKPIRIRTKYYLL